MSMMLRMAGTLGQRLEVDPALVGWWKFDGNLTDASGSGNNQEAIARGCQSPTIYWWSMRETKNGSWALLVGNEEIDEPEFSTEEPEWLKTEKVP